MKRRTRHPDDLDRVPIGELLRAAGDRFGVVVQDRWGTVTGILLTLAAIGGWIVENVYGPWRPDPKPFFYLNLAMSAGATVTVPLFIIADRIRSRRAAEREDARHAELKRSIDHLTRIIEAREKRP